MQPKAILEIGQPDQDEAEQCSTVPLIVQHNVRMVECILMQQMTLVENEHRMQMLPPELLDIVADRVEH